MSRSKTASVLLACLMAMPLLMGGVPQVSALPKSSSVALLGSPGDELSINGGGLHTSAFEFSQFSISYVSPSAVTSATSLAAYDTVVLNMASNSFLCSSANVPAAAKLALVQWVQQGGKLIFYDSECTPGIDYAWLDFPFSTDNPGAAGASAIPRITEENGLSCSDSALRCFIDVDLLGSQTDAVGDANIIVTQDLHWCADMQATNANGVTGYPHAYAVDGLGVYIYDGFDVDSMGTTPGTGTGSANLNKLFLLELELAWNPANLPCEVAVACATVPPSAAVSITRPALGQDYVDDVASPQPSTLPLPRVVGPLTLVVGADPAEITSLVLAVDGVELASLAAPPYEARWTSGPSAEGLHTISATFRESAAPHCTHTIKRLFEVPHFAVSGRATGVWVGTNAPAALQASNDGAGVRPDAPGSMTTRVADQTLDAPLDGRVIAIEDRADSTHEGSLWDIRTTSQTSHVDLLGGQVTADAIRVEARVTYDELAGHATAHTTATFVNLRVGGLPVSDPVPPDARLVLPNGARVELNEQTTSVSTGGGRAAVNAIHVFLPHDGFALEAIVGQATAAADPLALGGDTPRLLDPQDDAGTGGDAGDSFADPATLTMPAPEGSGHLLLAGRLAEEDRADHYAIAVQPGQEIVAHLVPSAEVVANVGEARAPPVNPGDSGAALRSVPAFTVRLLEPGSAEVRDDSARYVGAPTVGLNVDVAGLWQLEVLPAGALGNYTLDVVVRDVPLLPGDGGAPGADAGVDCAGALPMAAPEVGGVLRDADYDDVWSFAGMNGDKLAVTMKPGDDLDGADFDLYLYGPACQLLAESHGVVGALPKGSPEAIARFPLTLTGAYFVKVERVNGIGSYALTATAQHAIPDAPANDALSGIDAPAGCASAVPLPADAGVYGGTLDEGDAGDAFRFHVKAGDVVVLTAAGETLSDAYATVYGPGCVPLAGQSIGEVPLMFSLTPAAVGGDYVIEIGSYGAGGNYAVTVA